MYFYYRRWVSYIMCMTFLVTFSACLSQQPVPEDNFYRLSPIKSGEYVNTFTSGQVIAVKRFKSNVLYSERPLVYSDYSSVHLRQYHYHKWSDPLPRMLQNHLIDFLNKARVAGMVTSEGACIRPDYIIYGHIKRFDHLKIQNNDKVLVTLNLSIEKITSGQLVFLKEYVRKKR